MEKKNKLTPKKLKPSKKVKKVDKALVKADTYYNSGNSSASAIAAKTKSAKKKKRKKIFKIFFFIFLALFIIGAGVVIGIISGIVGKTDGIDIDEIKAYNLTSFVYDKDGNEIGQFFDAENRISIEYKDLPTHLVDAVIAIEDERFFIHNGVDVKRTVGAVFTYVLNGGKSNFGGSTVTQQLVKNVKNDKETSWTRKVREWYRAITLETKMSKEEIMAAYLSTIYLGDGSYGVEVASQNYFGKSVKDINVAESAVLAAAIQTPESTNPYKSEEAKQRLLDRKKVVLDKMLELEKITKEQYDEAVAYEIAFTKKEIQIDSGTQSYYVDAVFEQVKKDLIEQKGYTEAMAEKILYTDGLKIYTPQDRAVQTEIDNAFNNEKLFYTDRSGTFMQAAMVVIDHTNGNVVGLIGGADEKKGAREFNRATQANRQPGSCMKPIGAYGPAMEQGLIGTESGLDDAAFPANYTWQPGNYYGYFNGYVTVRDAIAQSMNLPAARANMKVDVDFAFNFAKNCGLKSLVSRKDNSAKNDESAASLALGGLTDGVTPLEMANAYATIANGGLYIEPKLYTKVVNQKGEEILIATSDAKRVMKDSTSYMLTSCLQSVVKPGGTAYGYVGAGNMAVAGKTGNTNDDKDQWFCGFTPYYTIACWNGYDQPKPIGARSFGTYPYTSVKLFNTVVAAISKNQTAKQFDRPSTVIEAAICRDSGLVSTDACQTDPRGNRTVISMFAKGSVPTATCTVHKKATVCKETGKLSNEFCLETEERSFITRDYEPSRPTNDAQYMIPKDKCDKHTTKQVVEEKVEVPKVDVYDEDIEEDEE